MRTRRSAVVILLVLAAVIAALVSVPASGAGKSGQKVRPEPETLLPSAKEGCKSGTTKNGVTTIPIKVGHYPGGLVSAVVNVCIGGKGPYPLTLDTGAAISALSTSLAEEVGLTSVGKPSAIEGAGCQGKAQEYKLPEWSVGGVALEGGKIETTNQPNSGKGNTRGSLGSDVLARFGAVRIDFKKETLTLVGKEGKAFSGSGKGASLPKGLVTGTPKLTIPMPTANAAGNVIPTVSVKIGSQKAQPFTVDTGAAFTVVNSTIVKAAKLKATGEAQKGSTFCSTITVPEYTTGKWSAGGKALKPQAVGSLELGKESAGLLGASTLAPYGSVVFDYAGGQLLLGVG